MNDFSRLDPEQRSRLKRPLHCTALHCAALRCAGLRCEGGRRGAGADLQGRRSESPSDDSAWDDESQPAYVRARSHASIARDRGTDARTYLRV